MKVLLAHNRYRSSNPSGENRAVEDDIRLLTNSGVEVIPFIRSSDEISLKSPTSVLTAATAPVISIPAMREFDRLVGQRDPHILHVHNVFPLISPWLVRRAYQRRLPVAMTIHNFRLGCVNGLFFRDGQVCTDCLGTTLGLAAVRHGCYRGSKLQTVPMVVGRAVHHDTWKLVTRFFVGSEFHARFLTALDVDPSRIVLRPNFAEDPGDFQPPGSDVLFVGRLEEGKGIWTLLEGWRRYQRDDRHRRLKIIGSGPLTNEVRAMAARTPAVDFLGPCRPEEVAAAMRAAAILAFPSHYLEPLPRVVVEAFSHGRSALMLDNNSLSSDVASVIWRVGKTPDDWAATLGALTREMVANRGRAARDYYVARLSPERSLDTLVGAYREAVEETR